MERTSSPEGRDSSDKQTVSAHRNKAQEWIRTIVIMVHCVLWGSGPDTQTRTTGRTETATTRAGVGGSRRGRNRTAGISARAPTDGEVRRKAGHRLRTGEGMSRGRARRQREMTRQIRIFEGRVWPGRRRVIETATTEPGLRGVAKLIAVACVLIALTQAAQGGLGRITAGSSGEMKASSDRGSWRQDGTGWMDPVGTGGVRQERWHTIGGRGPDRTLGSQQMVGRADWTVELLTLAVMLKSRRSGWRRMVVLLICMASEVGAMDHGGGGQASDGGAMPILAAVAHAAYWAGRVFKGWGNTKPEEPKKPGVWRFMTANIRRSRY